MNEPNGAPPASIPWLSSPVFKGILLSIVTQLLALFHVGTKFSPSELGMIVDLALQFIALAAAAWAAYKRHTSPVQPLAVTQAGADKKSADIAAKADSSIPVDSHQEDTQ